jgi:hypothetical protein
VRATGTPTPKELWNAYPLQPRKGGALPSATAGASPRASVAPSRSPAPTPVSATSGSGGIGWLPPALAAALAFAGGLVLGRRRRTAPPAAPAAPAPEAARAARPQPPVTPPAAPRPLQPRRVPAPPPPPPPPARFARQAGAVAVLDRASPRPVTEWRAEIVWRETEFVNMVMEPGAQPREDGGVPPEDARHTAELAEIARELEAEGWTPAGSGAHWHSRRYVWSRPERPPGTAGST